MQKYQTRDELFQFIKDAVLAPDFIRATCAGTKRGKSSEWARIVLRPVELSGRRHLQFAYQSAKKVITKNFATDEVDVPLNDLLDHGYAAIHISTSNQEIDIRTSRQGRVHIGRHNLITERAHAIEPHNRIKELPLPEGRANKLLELMGIATASGQVRASMRGKFTQINEFLKQLQHALEYTELGRLDREVTILDCGCGSSYLTIAAHHYLNDVLRIPARILGVDVNEEVIRKSMDRAARLGAARLDFECRSIGSIQEQADIVLALHACDTATDDAISQAVRSAARLLLCVPCCHHELNRILQAQAGDGVLRPLLRHGILRERTADLVTDAFRAQALRIAGYSTDVVEFVATEHTPRNLMIRAVYTPGKSVIKNIAEYQEMKRFWNVTPYIEKAMGEQFQQLVRPAPTMDEPV